MPFAIHGTVKEGLWYKLIVIVSCRQPTKRWQTSKGKKVARVAVVEFRNSAAAHFPWLRTSRRTRTTRWPTRQNDKFDHGRTQQSYDAGAIADDVLTRMEQRGVVEARALPRGSMPARRFPQELSAHDLDPALASKIQRVHVRFPFPHQPQPVQGCRSLVAPDYRDGL